LLYSLLFVSSMKTLEKPKMKPKDNLIKIPIRNPI
jgi:hypothetical protein